MVIVLMMLKLSQNLMVGQAHSSLRFVEVAGRTGNSFVSESRRPPVHQSSPHKKHRHRRVRHDPLKIDVFPKVCRPGLIVGPTEKYGVYIFNDDTCGTSIGILNLSDRDGMKEESPWALDRRFWQDKRWARDVHSIEWSKDGLTLTIDTNHLYGTNTKYVLDLRNRKIVSEIPHPIAQ
ncbi:hypothetical protein [Candidatus Odyssella thessalonicensis]|uniref:hypothetical protein n=1 Tax=Candidatus Odyssella thessalonicensis TaxID=84647 RepID=UPI000225BF82|nr:hypothetical protein [Candidatus Odyssella thessalonicensis]